MLPYRDSRITKVALVVFFCIIAGYAYFEARGALFGPSITVSQTVQEVSEPYIEIQGTAAHISELTMNGASVPVTQTGDFDVPYVLAPGFNRIVLDAKDKYGKKTERVIEIVYTASATSSTSSIHTASTTPATSTQTSLQSSTQGSSTVEMAQ